MIIDASVVFKWLIEEPGSDKAMTLIGQERMMAPLLLLSEVGNGLRRHFKGGFIDEIDPFIEQLSRLPAILNFVDERDDVSSALSLAAELDHSVYDCVYLAMALRTDDMLITADERFVRKLAGTRHEARVRSL